MTEREATVEKTAPSPDPASPKRDAVLFVLFALLGAAAANIHTQLPNSETYFELRWLFGLMGAVLIRRAWLALLLVALLSVAMPGDTPLATVFFGNMAYMLPTFVTVRLVHAHWLRRIGHPLAYAGAWLVLVLLCYQIFFTPILWGIVAVMRDAAFADGMLEGWATQPLLIESVLVALISAAGLTAFRMHERLHAQEQKYRRIFENAQDVYYEVDLAGTILEVSPSVARISGYTREELLGRSVDTLYTIPEEREALLQTLLREGRVRNYRISLRDKDGSIRQCSVSVALLPDVEGQPARLTGSLRDVSELERAEAARRESLLLLDKAEHLSRTGAWELDFANNTSSISENWRRLLGIETTSLDWTEFKALIHPDDLPRVEEAFRRAVDGDAPYEVTHRLFRKSDGAWMHIHCRGEVRRDSDGRPMKITGVSRDITPEHRLQEELQEQRNFLRLLLDQTPNQIFWKDRNLTYMGCNKEFAEITGIGSPENVVGMTDFDFPRNPSDSETYRALDRQVVETGEPILGLEEHYFTADGGEGTVLTYKVPIRNKHDSIIGVLGTCADITERKEKERQLAQNSHVLEHSPNAIYVSDHNGRLVYANAAATRQTGLTHDELLRRCVWDVDRSLEEADYPKLLAELPTNEAIMMRTEHRRNDGRIFPVEMSLSRMEHEGNVLICGIARDITEQESKEASLRRTQFSVDSAPFSVFWISPEGTFLYANEQAARSLGCTREELTGLGVEHVDPNFPRETRRRQWQLYKREGEADFESLHRRKDGSTFPVHVHSYYLDFMGQEMEVAEVEDITERKRAERDLIESEQRFRSFVENANDLVYAVSPEGIFTYVSPNWLEFMGEPAEEAIGSSLAPYVHPEDLHLCHAFLQKVLETGKKQSSVEYRVKHRDGSWRWHVSNGSPLRDADGKVASYLGIARDVTEAKRAEQALRESERELRAALRVARLGPWVFDLEREEVLFSSALQEILGLELPDNRLDLESAVALTHPDDQDAWRAGIQQAIETGEPVRCVSRVRHADGRMVWFQTETETVDRNEAGEPVRLFGINQDITEQHLMQERLRQMEKMDAIGQLAGGVAHDFNNQLAGVMGYADLLKSRLDDPVLTRYADGILVATRRAGDLTQKLLAFARKGQYERVAVDIHSLIHEVVEILNHSIDKRIEIKQLLTAAPSTTKGDPGQIQNALLNLAINASDAMQDGGVLVFETEVAHLDAAYCADVPYDITPGAYLRIGISDTGCGIPREHLDRIFEPFFTTKEVGKGTGMGLAAVYGTLKHHGGAINVYSEVGHGTTFRLYLPAEAGAVRRLEREAEIVAAPRTATILVVDDETILRQLTEDLLLDLGYQVRTEPDGAAGVAHFEAHWREIDLVILDMVMPRMNGPETYRAMKAIHPGVKVLLASGYSINGAAQGLLAEGVRGFLQKPFERAALSARIADALQDAPG